MRDYEGLVKRLQDFAAGTMRDEDAQTAFDAIDAIVELQKCVEAEYQSGFADGQISANRKKSKWISVEERLPEESYDGFSDDVLMLIEEPDGDKIWRDPYVGYYLYDACSDETGWWVKMTCDCTKVGEHKHGGKIYKANEYVTHWLPLPEPPEGES